MEPEERLQDIWSGGSYSEMETVYLPLAGELVEEAGIESGEDVLDVGCGTGNVAITAACRGADVIGLDVSPAMLERARDNAAWAGVECIDWQEGNATSLPFEDGAFDATISCLGHMFGDPPGDVTNELLRVTRSGGTIGFVSWTPTSVFPAMSGLVMTHLDAEGGPDFTEPPFMWGDADVVARRFGEDVTDLRCETATLGYPVLSPEHFWEKIKRNFGVFGEYLPKVDEDDRPALREQVLGTVEPAFDGEDNVVRMEYLLATATVA
ncbi:methyltransferase type 11 [Halobacteriales archaeon QS_1_68_20]|nr:MAG: methyltransferase type 11 [Halobacteriales archaeon QS_1_68_20]